MLHAVHAAYSGYNEILVCIVHTDVIMAVALVHILFEVDEVWVFYGNRKGFGFRKSTGTAEVSYSCLLLLGWQEVSFNSYKSIFSANTSLD